MTTKSRSKLHTIVALIIFLVLAVAVIVALTTTHKSGVSPTSGISFGTDQGNNSENKNPAQTESATSTPGVYKEKAVGFSFSYPTDASVKKTQEKDVPGETLLVTAKNGTEVQVSVLPFDENISLTADRIKKDIPDIVMRNSKSLTIALSTSGPSGTGAVYFETTNTREIWFVKNGNLYEISELLASPRDLLDSIVNSFGFGS